MQVPRKFLVGAFWMLHSLAFTQDFSLFFIQVRDLLEWLKYLNG